MNGRPCYPENIPAELQEYDQWVAWRWRKMVGGWTKFPVNPKTGSNASVTDSATWTTFEEALDYAREHNTPGVGFVLTSADPFIGVDLDDCRNSMTYAITNAKARGIITRLRSYTEVSPSSRGVKIFLKGQLPPGKRRTDTQGVKIETYDSGRFFTVTGRHVPWTPKSVENRSNEDPPGELQRLYRRYFERDSGRKRDLVKGVTRQRQPPRIGQFSGGNHLERTDDEILSCVLKCGKFHRLWTGNLSDYDDDNSRADFALCRMLAHWFGSDPNRIDHLFRRSALYRDKWERDDYRDRTIQKSILSVW